MAISLFAGDTLLGYLFEKPKMDWPRFYYDFQPTDEFEKYRNILNGPDRTDYSKKMDMAKDFELHVVNDLGEIYELNYIIIENNEAMIREGFIIR